MNFQDRISIAFPGGEPREQVALLGGELAGHTTPAYQAIVATATAARQSHTDEVTRLRKLESQLARRREELGLIVVEGDEVFDLPVGEMARRMRRGGEPTIGCGIGWKKSRPAE